jgi:hypothetical protein
MAALIRFYLHEDPDLMDDDLFCRRWCDLSFALKWDGKIEYKNK